MLLHNLFFLEVLELLLLQVETDLCATTESRVGVLRGGGECTADFKMYRALSFCFEMTAILGCAQLRERPMECGGAGRFDSRTGDLLLHAEHHHFIWGHHCRYAKKNTSIQARAAASF